MLTYAMNPVFQSCACGYGIAVVEREPTVAVVIYLKDIRMRQEVPSGKSTLIGRCPRCRKRHKLSEFWIDLQTL